MRKLIFDIKDIAKQIGCEPELLYSDVCILDNEISNDLTPDWIYTNAKIICTGFLYKNEITILLAEGDEDNNFIFDLLVKIGSFAKMTMLYAFNQNMETGNFKGLYPDVDLIINEIKPFRAKGWNKDRFFKTLIYHKAIPKLNVTDKFNGDGGKCIPAWAEYKKTGDFQNVLDIAEHNINCLVKECLILKNKKFFEENFVIDKNGFMLSEKRF